MSATLTAQAEALLTQCGLETTSTEKVVKPHFMTPHEIMQALQLYEAGETYVSIAEKVGRDRATIARNLDPFIDSAELARKWLSGKALEMAQAWTEAATKSASKGFHTAAKDALLHAHVIEPIADSGGAGTRVNVVIGIPGAPAPIPSVQVTQDQ